MIVTMLRHNPKERPSAKRVLLHPWIQKFAPGDEGGVIDVSPRPSQSVIQTPAPTQQSYAPPSKKPSVDDGVFVDAHVGRRESGGRRSSGGKRDSAHAGDTNPERQPSRWPVARQHPDRMDSNTTSRTKRSLRPSHRAADEYEGMVMSPPSKSSATRHAAGLGSQHGNAPSQASRRSQSPRNRATGEGMRSVGGLVASRPNITLGVNPIMPSTSSRGRQPHVGSSGNGYGLSRMDAGVVFNQHKPSHAHQYGDATVLEMHKHRSSGRIGYDMMDEVDDGWDQPTGGYDYGGRSQGRASSQQHQHHQPQQRIWIPDGMGSQGAPSE